MRSLTFKTDPTARPETGPIGLHVSDAGVRMAQLSLNQPGARPTVHATFRFCQAAPGAGLAPRRLFERIRQALDAAPFIGRRVVASVPQQILHFRTVRVETTVLEDLDEAARREAAGLFPFPLSEAIVNYLPAGIVEQGGQRRTEVTVMASLCSEIDRFIRSLDSAGLIVESLDAEACAFFRWSAGFARARADDPSPSFILDLGATRSQVIFGRGSRLTFIKALDLGADRIDALVSRRLGVDPIEARLICQRLDQSTGASSLAVKIDPIRKAMTDATRAILTPLARALTGCMRYHAVTFRADAPAHLWLVGERSNDASVGTLLSALIGLPVMTQDQYAKQPAAASTEHELALAIGLGLKKLCRLPGRTYVGQAEPVCVTGGSDE